MPTSHRINRPNRRGKIFIQCQPIKNRRRRRSVNLFFKFFFINIRQNYLIFNNWQNFILRLIPRNFYTTIFHLCCHSSWSIWLTSNCNFKYYTIINCSAISHCSYGRCIINTIAQILKNVFSFVAIHRSLKFLFIFASQHNIISNIIIKNCVTRFIPRNNNAITILRRLNISRRRNHLRNSRSPKPILKNRIKSHLVTRITRARAQRRIRSITIQSRGRQIPNIYKCRATVSINRQPHIIFPHRKIRTAIIHHRIQHLRRPPNLIF